MLRLVLGQPGMVVLLVVTSVAAGFLESAIFAVVAEVATAMAAGTKHVTGLGPLQISTNVATLLAVGFCAAVLRLLMAIVIGYLPPRIATRIEAHLRSDLLSAFSRTSWAVKSVEREGHFQDLMTLQINQVLQCSLYFLAFLSSVCTFAAFVISAFVLSVPAALLVLAVAAVLFLLLRPLDRLGSKTNESLSQVGLDYANGITEAVRMAEETQVFGVEEEERRLRQHDIERTRHLTFRSAFIARLVPGLYQSLVIVILIFGLLAVYLSGTTHIATLGAVILILLRSAAYGQQAQFSNNQVRSFSPYFDRVEGVKAEYLAHAVDPGVRPLDQIHSVSFEDVTFAYRAGVDVLSHVSFAVTGRKIVGIIGPSGAGKSTLVQILLRLREPTSGELSINGEPAMDILRTDWHRQVAYVPQDPKILRATVADNIRYLRQIDDAAIVRAAKLAHIHDDIVGWPQGYETVIGQRADAVSGGQRQRLCLARALAGSPQVLVLDEPTSALDVRSESLVQESLDGLRGQMTVFIVAHRLSTLSICDELLVLVDGRAEAFGPRAEIEQTNAYYRGVSGLIVSDDVPAS